MQQGDADLIGRLIQEILLALERMDAFEGHLLAALGAGEHMPLQLMYGGEELFFLAAAADFTAGEGGKRYD